jgi:hypothetical protein
MKTAFFSLILLVGAPGCISTDKNNPPKLFIVREMVPYGRQYRCTYFRIAPMCGVLDFIDYDTGREVIIRDHYKIYGP